MADIQTRGLPGILAAQAAAAQASAGRSLDFSPGGLLRALAEGFGAIALWLQAMALAILARTRLATSSGADADTFVADFGVSRIAATFATGEVTFSRIVTGLAAFIPVGTLVRTADGSATFAVTAALDNGAYDTGLGGYTIASGTASLTVPVQAATAGTAGNAANGTVTLLVSAIAGVDTVTNASSFAGGAAAETDAELRDRFPRYLLSLSRATDAAIEYAIGQAVPGVFTKLIPNEDAAGDFRGGHFLVVVDDGTVSPPTTAVAGAIENVRGLGITYDVLGATPVTVNVAMSLTVRAGASLANAQAAVEAAVLAYIADNRGVTLPYTRLAQLAYDADPNITAVSSVTLNSGTADVTLTSREVLRAGTVAIG